MALREFGITLGRIGLTVIAGVLALIGMRVVLIGLRAPAVMMLPMSLVAAGFGGAAAWRLAGAGNPIVQGALLGAGLLGTIGFAGGFFGPMLFTPEANQGPMLGIFITGPLGGVLGAVAGGLWGAHR
jgi:hypothetical protein